MENVPFPNFLVEGEFVYYLFTEAIYFWYILSIIVVVEHLSFMIIAEDGTRGVPQNQTIINGDLYVNLANNSSSAVIKSPKPNFSFVLL